MIPVLLENPCLSNTPYGQTLDLIKVKTDAYFSYGKQYALSYYEIAVFLLTLWRAYRIDNLQTDLIKQPRFLVDLIEILSAFILIAEKQQLNIHSRLILGHLGFKSKEPTILSITFFLKELPLFVGRYEFKAFAELITAPFYLISNSLAEFAHEELSYIFKPQRVHFLLPLAEIGVSENQNFPVLSLLTSLMSSEQRAKSLEPIETPRMSYQN